MYLVNSVQKSRRYTEHLSSVTESNEEHEASSTRSVSAQTRFRCSDVIYLSADVRSEGNGTRQ